MIKPTCLVGIYDCKNCSRPTIQLTPRSFGPCDGTIHFCKYAIASTATTACHRYSLQKYACTHGGAGCAGCREEAHQIRQKQPAQQPGSKTIVYNILGTKLGEKAVSFSRGQKAASYISLFRLPKQEQVPK